VVTLFIAGPSQVTLPRQMFTGIRENINPTIAAVATLLILFTTALMGVLEWIRGRQR
jgi:putative spermidine/putrescine transport system permease protein